MAAKPMRPSTNSGFRELMAEQRRRADYAAARHLSSLPQASTGPTEFTGFGN